MKSEKTAPKKVNVTTVVDALKVQSKVRAGIVVGTGPGAGCLLCGQGGPGGGFVTHV
jgi:hypothetical protein